MRSPRLVVVAVLLGACAVRAQTMPQPDGSLGVRLGVESFGPPVVVVDATFDSLAMGALEHVKPVAQARLDLHGRVVALLGGAVLEQRFGERLFLREAVQLGPFVATVDDVAIGARAGLLAQVGYDLGDAFTIAAGPELVPVVAFDTSAGGGIDGRLGCALGGVVRWFVVPRAAATLTLSGGYDLGGRGAGAVTGVALLGAVVDW
ncbi:MAG: hypothetical protein FJ137_00775 [Deltaproteobacteria bacterium]|nr:hypothetical protein [Deltaproteobacteria bacterium]